MLVGMLTSWNSVRRSLLRCRDREWIAADNWSRISKEIYLELINLAAQSKDNPRREVDLLVRCQEVIAERLRVARRRLVDQENQRDYLEMVNLGKVSARLQREYLEGATQ